MKANRECNFRETVILIFATAATYAGAFFVLVFDNAFYGITAAAVNFFFWTWVIGFFVFFGKDTVFGRLPCRSRLIISLFFWLSFCSKRFNDWFRDQLGSLDSLDNSK